MILFNLIFAQNILEFSDYVLVNTNSQPKVKDNIHKKSKRNFSIVPCVISNTDFLARSKDNLADKELMPNNLFKALINTFWRQTIFLSVPTKLSEKYTDQLNSLNFPKNKVSQKKFLSQLSKSFTNGSIQSSLSKNLVYDRTAYSIRYIWEKSFNLKSLINFDFSVFSTARKSLQEIEKKLKVKNLPLFIVTNHLDQMVIAEPPETLSLSNNIKNVLFNGSSCTPMYQGWFFTNFQDAEEYLEHIKKQYCISDFNNKLQIFICNLETFYKLSRESRNTVQFRLVPDLNEIGKLVTEYSSYRNIFFNKSQNYGKNYFQGQPVYTIKDQSICYYSLLSTNKKKIKYRPVFTNYETAIYSWNNFLKKQSYSNSKVQKCPELVVYNLEDFLEEQINAYDRDHLPFLLVPSKGCYEFAKNSQLKTYIINNVTSTYFSYFRLWAKRILWSLTSRQPQDW